jgi:2-polyprenyl-3-methyl-5-hydroxy-6-metoxy-1,4-benzoquinol methylase
MDDIQDELSFVLENTFKGDQVLDVGSGAGWFAEWVATTGRVSAAVDPYGKPSLAVDGYYDHVRDVPGYEFLSLARCHHVIEHVDKPRDMIAEIRTLLKPGGWLLISTPDFGGACAAQYGDRYRMLHDPTHCSLFTNESMHRFLRDHGFEIERVTYPMAERHWGSLYSHLECGEMNGWSPPFPGNHMTFYARKV